MVGFHLHPPCPALSLFPRPWTESSEDGNSASFWYGNSTAYQLPTSVLPLHFPRNLTTCSINIHSQTCLQRTHLHPFRKARPSTPGQFLDAKIPIKTVTAQKLIIFRKCRVLDSQICQIFLPKMKWKSLTRKKLLSLSVHSSLTYVIRVFGSYLVVSCMELWMKNCVDCYPKNELLLYSFKQIQFSINWI